MNVTDTYPLVSIITPFFNSEKFFEECIRSVLAQTYPRWELMLIDDGSSDASTQIAREYAEAYPDKIFYLEHEGHANRGASTSRNLGIRSCRGSIIAFLDSDDIYLPDKLKDQVPILQSFPEAALLYSGTSYWHSWTGAEEDAGKDWTWYPKGVPINQLIPSPQVLTLYLEDGSTVPCMGSILVRKEAIVNAGGWEDSFTYVNTDQVFHAKICLNYPIVVSDGCWDRYRQHPGSSTSLVLRTKKSFEARKNFLAWLGQYLSQNGVQKNSSLWKAFRVAWRPYQFPAIYHFNRVKQAVWRRLKIG